MREFEIDGKKIFISEENIQTYRDERLIYLLDKCSYLVDKESRSALKAILRAIKKYPRIPKFRNLLAIAYANRGLDDKAYEVVLKTTKLFPDYFYARINLIQILLLEEEPDFEYIGELLGGEHKSLISFSPGVETFYEKDFFDYYSQYAHFEAKQGNREGVEKALEPLLDFFGDEHPAVINLGKKVASEVMTNGLKRYNSFNHAEVESFPVFTLESADSQPKLTHSELYSLYDYSTEKFPADLMAKIMSLPRASLIEDLERILYDSIRRFDMFQDEENSSLWDGKEWKGDFSISAHFFLAGLGAEEKLESVLNILRQGKDYLNFWYSDYLNNYIEPTLYLLGKGQLDVLQKFAMEPNIFWIAKSAVIDVMVQVAIQDEAKREEIIRRITEIVNHIAEHPDDESLFDTNLFSSIVASALDLAAKELLPLIEDLFERGWVDPMVSGDWEEVKLEMAKPFNPFYKRNIPKDIFEIFSGRYNASNSKPLLEEIEQKISLEGVSRASKFLTKIIFKEYDE